MNKTGNLSEQRTAGASYILNFYQTIVDLKSAYANYVNLIKEFEQKYGKTDAEKMTEQDREILKQQAQTTRYYIIHSYIDYSTVHKSLGQEKNTLKTKYEKVSKDFILQIKELEDYVFAANEALATGIIKDLLQTSQDVINDIYGE